MKRSAQFAFALLIATSLVIWWHSLATTLELACVDCSVVVLFRRGHAPSLSLPAVLPVLDGSPAAVSAQPDCGGLRTWFRSFSAVLVLDRPRSGDPGRSGAIDSRAGPSHRTGVQ